jgi:acetyl esterase/lipase
MPFDHLPRQTPINLRADAYGETCLLLSRLAAMTTRRTLDVPYGPDPAQRLDLYFPADRSLNGLPVFINIHGGGWTHGYKEWLGLNAPVIVAFPAIYVSVEYRLAPASKHPGQVEDCLMALAWVWRNIAGLGGDPDRIHVGGHSAGAHIAALIALRPEMRAKAGLPPGVVKSCFPYNGVYDLRDLRIYGQPASAGPNADLLARPGDASDASPLLFAEANDIPFFVVWAENDNPLVKAEGPGFVTALQRGKGRVEALMFPLFDHFWTHIDQQRPENAWTRTLMAWMLGDPRTAPVASL